MALFNAYSMMLERIREPLTKFILDPNKEGDDFADFLIDLTDYGTYQTIRSLGEETICSAIIAYSPLWDAIKEKGLPRLTGFVKRFCDAEAIWDKEEEEESKKEDKKEEAVN